MLPIFFNERTYLQLHIFLSTNTHSKMSICAYSKFIIFLVCVIRAKMITIFIIRKAVVYAMSVCCSARRYF